MWVRLKVTEAMTDTIIAAVEAQKSWPKWTKQNGAFIPNPATWLNAGGWDDEPPPVVRAGVSEKTAGNIDAAKRFIERMKGKKPEGES